MNIARIAIAALLVFLLAPSVCQAKLPPDARQVLFKSQQLMDDKKFTEAAAMIRTYMDTTEDAIDAQVWLSLGGALYEADKKQEAVTAFRSGHAAHPADVDLCLNTGIVLFELEQYAEAAAFLEKAAPLQKPEKPELLFQAGYAYYLGKRFRDSSRVMQKLLAGHPSPSKEWIRLAIHAMLEAGQTAKAETMLVRFLTVSPEEADYWQLLAKLHLEREQYTKATAALEICYQLKKPTTGNLERLASLYRYRQAPLMAAATLVRAYALSPTPEQALKVAALYASAGRISQAVEYLNHHAGTPPAELEKGKMLYQDRRFKEAEAVFHDLLTRTPLPEAHFYLALCAWEREDWELAAKELDRIAGVKQFKGRASGYLAVLNDLDQARREAEEE